MLRVMGLDCMLAVHLEYLSMYLCEGGMNVNSVQYVCQCMLMI